MAVRECGWFYINVPGKNIQIKLKLILKLKRVLGLVLRGRTTLCLWTGHGVCLAQFWHALSDTCISTVKPALSGHSKRRQKLIFKTPNRLMQVKSIAEGSILQYF